MGKKTKDPTSLPSGGGTVALFPDRMARNGNPDSEAARPASVTAWMAGNPALQSKGVAMNKVPVVLRFKDGRVEKTFAGPYFSHSLKVVQVIGEGRGVITVPVEDLKAVFFVEDLEGKGHQSGSWREENTEAGRAGKNVLVIFKDGEQMRGKVLGDITRGAGFFLIPTEKNSNNLRVFIIRSAAQEVTFEE
jgi:hypothetical protein